MLSQTLELSPGNEAGCSERESPYYLRRITEDTNMSGDQISASNS